MAKKPKFFCEYCGTEVKGNDRVCPHCGKFFASVRCPSCGFSGASRDFASGCPVCGYAFGAGEGKVWGQRGKLARPTADPLPWWVFAALLAVAAVMLTVIIRAN